MEPTINKLKENGLKLNTQKSFFGQTEIKYLSSGETRESIRPIKKLEAIKNMNPPPTKIVVRKLLGLPKQYRDILARTLHTLNP